MGRFRPYILLMCSLIITKSFRKTQSRFFEEKVIIPKYLDIPHFTFVSSKEIRRKSDKNSRKGQKTDKSRKSLLCLIQIVFNL